MSSKIGLKINDLSRFESKDLKKIYTWVY